MANVHVIIGEDDFLVSETAKKIVGDGTGLEVIDSLNASNAELQLADLQEADASFSTPPFLDPRKVTWWKNVHFLPSAGKKQAAEEVKVALERFAAKLAAASLPENQHFILSGPRLKKDSKLAKTLATTAEIVTFAAGKPWEQAKSAVARITAQAAERGLAFEAGAAERFVARVGTDARSLVSELEKMRTYLGEGHGTVRIADVEEVSSPGVGVEPEVWAITDALGERNLEKCLAAAQRFARENGFAVLITTVVEKFFRQLLDVAAGRTEGLAPFAVRKLSGFLRNWTPNELRIARWRFLTLRERVVSGTKSGDVLTVNELVRVCRRTRPR